MNEFMTVKMHNGKKAIIRKSAVFALIDDILPDASDVTRILFAGSNAGIVTNTPIDELIDQIEPPEKKTAKAVKERK